MTGVLVELRSYGHGRRKNDACFSVSIDSEAKLQATCQLNVKLPLKSQKVVKRVGAVKSFISSLKLLTIN